MKKHIAIFVGDTIEDILSGRKTIETRFSKVASLPYLKIAKGDIVLLKQSSSDILGQFEVDNVLFFDKLSKKDVDILKRQYEENIIANEKYWQKAYDSNFASIIFIKKAERYLAPIKYKKNDRRSWLIL